MPWPIPALVGTLLAMIMLVAACTNDDGNDSNGAAGNAATGDAADDSTDNSDAVTGDSSSDDGRDSDGADSGDSDDDGTDDSGSDDGSDPDDDPDDGGSDPGTELPGEPWDGFADAGDVLAVFGVADDDSLNIRSIPGTGGEVVATAAPTATDLVATGRARQLPRSFWYEVQVIDENGTVETGWAAIAFLAFIGPVDDATAEYLAANDPPVNETLVDLAQEVAQYFASDEPPSEIIQSVAPSVGDLGEITVDVVGIGDDAGAGYRLHIFATENENGETWDLRTIERTEMCTRGISDGRCT